MQGTPEEWAVMFEPPRRASWPGPMTRLERLAERMGVDSHEYRELLQDAVQGRLRARGAAWERLDNRLDKRANGR